jgi:AcrR family transcriptional regulator
LTSPERPVPRRLSPEQSRDAALDAARALLVEGGPQAMTLKAVATRIGRTHANLLHHFGSAAGLHQALVARMAGSIVAEIRAAVLAARAGEQDPAEIVRLTFDAFDTGGAGALCGWMILSGDTHALAPVMSAIHDLVDELTGTQGLTDRPVAEETLQLVLSALGDALLGAPMAAALGLPRDTARRLALNAMTPTPSPRT